MAVISTLGAALTELVISDTTVVSAREVTNPEGMFFGSLLAPWPNRLRDGKYSFADRDFKYEKLDAMGNANHGLLFDRNLEVIETTDSTVSLRYEFGGDVCYPFKIELVVSYSLTEVGLKVEAVAKNHGQDAPFGIGFHPYFLAGENFEFSAAFTHQVQTDSKMIPLGDLEISGLNYSGGALDDCFYGAIEADLRNENFGLRFSLEDNLSYFMLYRPQSSKVSLLAIEPMSCRANAFNSSPVSVLLASGETKKYSFTIRKL